MAETVTADRAKSFAPNRIKEYRQRAGLSLRELGALAGVDYRLISYAELDRQGMPDANKIKVCEALGAALGEVIGITDVFFR